MEVFQDYAYYYNAFYKDKDYRKEAEDIDFLLKKYSTDTKPVKLMNFGCGTGRHDIELSKFGYQCDGIDMSPLMIKIAKKNSCRENTSISFEVADVRSYIPHSQYDAVISLFHVMSYQNSNSDILSAFKSARKALKPGGIFLFDVWYGPGVLSDRPCVRVKEVEDDFNLLTRIARPVMHDKENIVDVNYNVLIVNKETGKVQTINELHKMRYFFRPELELLLDMSGFKIIDNFDCESLGKTDYSSWTSYFAAQAV